MRTRLTFGLISLLLLCAIAWAQTTVTVTGQYNMGSSVVLTWVASTSTGVTNYNIYRGPHNGPYTWVGQVGAVTTWTDSGAPPKAQACYVTTAYNGTTHLESTNSNEACGTLP